MATEDTRTFGIRVYIDYMGQFVDISFVLDKNTAFLYNLIILFVFEFSAAVTLKMVCLVTNFNQNDLNRLIR